MNRSVIRVEGSGSRADYGHHVVSGDEANLFTSQAALFRLGVELGVEPLVSVVEVDSAEEVFQPLSDLHKSETLPEYYKKTL